jgi:hypothetical protein
MARNRNNPMSVIRTNNMSSFIWALFILIYLFSNEQISIGNIPKWLTNGNFRKNS